MDSSRLSNVRDQLATLNSKRESLGLPTSSNLDVRGLLGPMPPIDDRAHLPTSSRDAPFRVTGAPFNGLRTLPLPTRSDRSTMARNPPNRASAASGRVRKVPQLCRRQYSPRRVHLRPCSPPPGYDSRGKRLADGNPSLRIVEANRPRTATESSEDTNMTSDDEPAPPPKLVCAVCHKYQSTSTTNLNSHMRTVHADNPMNGSHVCTECGSRYKSRAHLMRHAKVTGHQDEILKSV